MPVEIYYLEMNAPNEHSKTPLPPDLEIQQLEIPKWKQSKALYIEVGQHWQWTDKLQWADSQWIDYADRTELKTWVIQKKKELVGYYELEVQTNGSVEIVYFGLTKAFIGKGLGSATLTQAIRSAWKQPETKRVWLHTCSLDHPKALQNYIDRGFKHYKTEIQE